MSIQIYPHALTTLARVKDRLGLTTTGFDNVLLSMINAVTDFIEHETNTHFKQSSYVEIQSARSANQKYLYVKNPPIVTLTKLEYSAGIPSQKNWMEFPVTQYETLEDGQSGCIYVYGYIPQGPNRIRITYTAGYLFDFANAGDPTKHQLPMAISELADNLVTRAFKRREKNGLISEGFNGANISYRDEMDGSDKQTLSNYIFIRFV